MASKMCACCELTGPARVLPTLQRAPPVHIATQPQDPGAAAGQGGLLQNSIIEVSPPRRCRASCSTPWQFPAPLEDAGARRRPPSQLLPPPPPVV